MTFWNKLVFWRKRKDKVVQRYHYKKKPKPEPTADKPEPTSIKVFTYGTLKQGFYNHRYLEESSYGEKAKVKFLGRTSYTGGMMYDNGSFPIVVLSGNGKIFGEVYEVNDIVFQGLDRLEGYPSMYVRSKVKLDNGQTAWIYHQNIEKVRDLPIVKGGVYQQHNHQQDNHCHLHLLSLLLCR